MADKPKQQAEEPVRNDRLGLKRKLDYELDRLEGKLEELRMLYEQYFIDVLPQPPAKLRAEVVKTIRQLLKAPFRTSAIRFRLRMLVHRYQTYHTYWERVMKEREEGTYSRDLFKADLRDKMLEDAKKDASRAGRAEKAMRQLFNTYEEALRKSNISTERLSFDAFKKSLLKKAKQIKQEQGVKKLQYKVVVKEGKVTIKASGKK